MKKLFSAMLTAALCCALILCAAPDAKADDVQVEQVEVSRSYTFEPIGTPNELLTGFLYGSRGISTYSSNTMLNRLGEGVNKDLYVAAKAHVTEVAAGREAQTTVSIPAADSGIITGIFWTAEELGVSEIVEGFNNNGKPIVSDAAMDAVAVKIGLDPDRVFDALRADCPYEMYWCSNSVSYTYCSLQSRADGTYKLGPSSNISINLRTVREYAGASETSVSTDKTEAAAKAASNAHGIVSQFSDASDYNKLLGYTKKLCDLNTYNEEAAEESKYDDNLYGDPWQLIYMFDNDPSTNVVCEGYSKAMQFLCELTAFESDKIWVSCASGNRGGNHMWNVAHMDDGRNYLLDVTNCDQDWGFYKNLFLAPATSGSWDGTFYVAGLSYTYFGETTALYSQDELAISQLAYGKELTPVKAAAATCDKPGNTAYYACGDQWFSDKLAAEPITDHSNVMITVPHTPEVFPAAVAPTCTTPGSTAGSRCAVCETVLTEPETVKALGHKYNSEVTTPPTCLKDGERTYTCIRCDDSYTETIAAPGHDLGDGTVCEVCGTEVHICGKSEEVFLEPLRPATLDAPGQIAIYCCPCEKAYLDAACTKEITAAESAIPQVTTLKLSATAYTYDGTAKTPTVTVKDAKGNTLAKNTDYTVSYASGRKNVGSYKVTIKGKGNYSFTKTLTFKINPVKSAISKLAAGKQYLTVRWAKKTTQTTGYQIQYGLKKDFSGAKTVTIKPNTTLSKTIKNLKSAKIYYVRIRTFRTISGVNYYSGWSGTKYIKVK